MSSFFTKLMATPFRPYLPERPILPREEGTGDGAAVGGRSSPSPRGSPSLPVDVEFSVVGQVVVDDQRHLRHVQAPGPNVCGNENSAAKRGAQSGLFWERPGSSTEQPLLFLLPPAHQHHPHFCCMESVSCTITKLQSRQDQTSLDLSEGIMFPSVQNIGDRAQTFFP